MYVYEVAFGSDLAIILFHNRPVDLNHFEADTKQLLIGVFPGKWPADILSLTRHLQKLCTHIGLHPVLLFACQSLSCYGGHCNAVMDWLEIQKFINASSSTICYP